MFPGSKIKIQTSVLRGLLHEEASKVEERISKKESRLKELVQTPELSMTLLQKMADPSDLMLTNYVNNQAVIESDQVKQVKSLAQRINQLKSYHKTLKSHLGALSYAQDTVVEVNLSDLADLLKDSTEGIDD